MNSNDATLITPAEQAKIAYLLDRMYLTAGIGTLESACSIAAINIALSGELSDQIPDCMSMLIGVWVIHVQDAMPGKMRNSSQWKALLPQAAGTGRNYELERLARIQHWMWDVLQLLQPIADRDGFGIEWREMCRKRCAVAADAARAAARAAEVIGVTVLLEAAARAARDAAEVTARSEASAVYAVNAVVFAASAFAADAASTADLWPTINPPALLQELIRCGQPEQPNQPSA